MSEDFEEFVRTLKDLELVILSNDMRQHNEDKEKLRIVEAELKKRSKERSS